MARTVNLGRLRFIGTLAIVDQPSDKAVSGARGHRVLLPLPVAEDLLRVLVGKVVLLRSDGMTKRCGLITSAELAGDKLQVRGYVYAHDCPELVERMRSGEPLGMSWSMKGVSIEDFRSDVWVITDGTFGGVAVLDAEKAGWSSTTFRLAEAE